MTIVLALLLAASPSFYLRAGRLFDGTSEVMKGGKVVKDELRRR